MAIAGNNIAPIRRVNLTSQVMESVKDYIVTNDLPPGARLPSEKELTVKLKVSRNILREALKSLEAVGLIEIKVGDGMYVSDFDYSNVVTHISFALSRNTQEFEHFIEARLITEVAAMELVAERLTDEDLRNLEECNDRLAQAETIEEAAEIDFEFHRELLAIARNPVISEFGSFLVQFFKQGSHMVDGDAKFRTARGHMEILDALRARDAALLKETMRKHILTWKGTK